MPVQFVCPECQATLSVGRRKIGCQVSCPKCQAQITVLSGDGGPPSTPDGLPDFAGVPELVGGVPPIQRFPLNQPLAITPVASQRQPANTLYLQVAVLLLVAIVAFVLGYWYGGVSARRGGETSESSERPTQVVLA